jgi:hypothetical protein
MPDTKIDEKIIESEPLSVEEDKWLDYFLDLRIKADEKINSSWDRLTSICIATISLLALSFRAFKIEANSITIAPIIFMVCALFSCIFCNLPTEIKQPKGGQLKTLKECHDERLRSRSKFLNITTYVFFVSFIYSIMVVFLAETEINKSPISPQKEESKSEHISDYVITGAHVRVRSEPDINSRILDELDNGKFVKFISLKNNWIKISYKNHTTTSVLYGWVYSHFVYPIKYN